MFKQTSRILNQQTKPYFAFVVTLTNHHPFIIDEKLAKIKLLPEHKDTKFGNYLQTAHYTDEAIGEFIKELKEKEISVVALEQDPRSISYTKINTLDSEKIAIIVGNEVEGISRETLDQADAIIEIPMHGKKNSLNVAVATGIALFELIKG
jgi:tRNA(Leu) C34 or U34 (ribose-2'-O)-methylase TrmL